MIDGTDGRARRTPARRRSCPFLPLLAGMLLALVRPAGAQWLPVSKLSFGPEQMDYGGESIFIEYDLTAADLSPDEAAYVFVRYSADGGRHWSLVPARELRGDGADIVARGGHHALRWWGSDQLGLTTPGADLKIAVRALRMVRVSGGRFVAKMIPGGAFDRSQSRVDETMLPTYYLAKCETTVGMYADYLNEAGKHGRGWNRLMANPARCGILRQEGETYVVATGRGNFPINYVSWYEAQAFLDWCGLRLPSELEYLKALRGGVYLDGDDGRRLKNPLPERKFPWGDEPPEAGGLLRCNCYVDDPKSASRLAPVGSFGKFNSPYGACDLAGNVDEWTLDRYTTPYHDSIGIDGYRMIKGGSYLTPGVGCDALTGASQLPAKCGSSLGFRGVRGAAPIDPQ